MDPMRFARHGGAPKGERDVGAAGVIAETIWEAREGEFLGCAAGLFLSALRGGDAARERAG